MKISYNWLKDYISLDVTAETISQLLTDGGLEVESIEKTESIKGGLKGLVVGEVMSCTKHPNADKLSVTTVKIGEDQILPIVCGAPNVAMGQKVIVATEGTILFSGDESFEIKKSKIRGEVSEGMICAEDEIGLGSSHDGIMILDETAKIGTPASDFFDIKTDYVFEIGITPNRSDATSHIGVARDLIALLNFHKNKNLNLRLPNIDNFKVENHSLPFKVNIQNQNDCPRYSMVSIANIKVEESPKWIQDRIKSIGLRPINNIVDITNYILMETGQPLHAFDYDKVYSKQIVVQKLETGTPFKTLEGFERKLTSDDLMICDNNSPMCLGGIFGGAESGVSLSTTNILIESAYFNPVTIRKSSKYHGLKTDASFRFERGADPNITVYALKRAALLIKEIAGGQISSDIIDLYPHPINPLKINVNFDNIEKVIGQRIENKTIISILKNLDIEILSENENEILIEVPTNKVDVIREIDVIEEILRVYGFNNVAIGNTLKSSLSFRQKPDNEVLVNIISDFLVAKGFSEAMNNSLTKSDYYGTIGFEEKKSIQVLNPLSSELNVLRQHLIFGLLESVKRNINHKTKNIKLFEFGKHYSKKSDLLEDITKITETTHLALIATGEEIEENWNYPARNIDFYSLKSILFSLLDKLGIEKATVNIKESNENPLFTQSLLILSSGKLFAEIGKLSSSITKEFDFTVPLIYCDIDWQQLVKLTSKSKTSYQGLSKYPAVRRDMAILIDSKVNFSEIEQIALKTDNKLLKSISLFDVYEGKGIEPGKKSYAISFILQDDEKTLTDQVIDKIMNKIQQNLERNLNAKLR